MDEALKKYNQAVNSINSMMPLALDSMAQVVKALMSEIDILRKENEALKGKLKTMESPVDQATRTAGQPLPVGKVEAPVHPEGQT